MARELRRLLIAPDRLARAATATELSLEPEEAHYLRRVLRARAGDRLEVVDGIGGLWTARLEERDGLALEQPAAEPLRRQPAPFPTLSLGLAVPRRDPELVWRMATELGIDRLQPLVAERSVIAGRWPLERWQTIVREAVEQCERLWQPRLLEPVAAAEWLQGSTGGLNLLATTRRAECPLLATVLDRLKNVPGAAVTLAIGPEGGWTQAEERVAIAAGWHPVSLGPTILRSSTAAVAGAAALASWRALTCPSFPSPSP